MQGREDPLRTAREIITGEDGELCKKVNSLILGEPCDIVLIIVIFHIIKYLPQI